MDLAELELIKKLNFGNLSEQELLDVFYKNRDKYRILVNLIQQPKFSERFSLDIISKLFPVDLMRVIKNKRTNPFIRKKAEIEFTMKYRKFPIGEKLSLLRVAPNSLLNYFIKENDKRILKAILNNRNCSEGIILKFINMRTQKFDFYEELILTDWYKRPSVVQAIIRDIEAPIKLILKLIPLLTKTQLKKLYKQDNTHEIVKSNIEYYLESKKSDPI